MVRGPTGCAWRAPGADAATRYWGPRSHRVLVSDQFGQEVERRQVEGAPVAGDRGFPRPVRRAYPTLTLTEGGQQ